MIANMNRIRGLVGETTGDRTYSTQNDAQHLSLDIYYIPQTRWGRHSEYNQWAVLLMLKWDVKVRIGHVSRPSLVMGVSQEQ